MEVKTFDPEKGIYSFEVTALDAALHAHPLWEVCWAKAGKLIVTKEAEAIEGQ